MAVNDAGLVVGLSKVQGTSGEAVMWVGSQIYALTPDDHLPGSAEAVGEGATTVFIGGTALYERRLAGSSAGPVQFVRRSVGYWMLGMSMALGDVPRVDPKQRAGESISPVPHRRSS